MIIKNIEPVGFFSKSDIGFIGEKVYVRKFDNFGICFYERHFDNWNDAQTKFEKTKR